MSVNRNANRSFAAVIALVALAFALTAAPASADQSLFDFFGSQGSGAGQLGIGTADPPGVGPPSFGAGGLAVNNTSGDVYVADRANNRIEQFDSDGNFIRGWGVDVISNGASGTGLLTTGSKEVTTVVTTSKAFIAGQEVSVSAGGGVLPAGTTITEVKTAGGVNSKLFLSKAATTGGSVTLTAAEGSGNSAPQNEQQKVSVSATAGNFKLSLKTTSPNSTTTTGNIAFNAPAKESEGAGSVEAALKALTNIGAGNVEVTGSPGGPYTVEFKGTRFADTNVAQMTTAAGSPALSGAGATVTVETTVDGAAHFEKCTAATTCQSGTVSGIAGGMGRPNSVAIAQGSGDLYVSDTGNIRVDQFDSTGTPIRAWGGNVVESGPDNVPGGGPEICNVATDICRAGVGGTVGGQFGGTVQSAIFEGFLAISPAGPYAGDIFVADNSQKRIQMFTPTGVFVGTFGLQTIAGTGLNEESHLCLVSLGQTCSNTAFFSGVTPEANAVDHYGFLGTGAGSFIGFPPIRFAIDQTGAVYVINNRTLQKYSPDLLVEKDFAPNLCTLKPSPFENCADVAVDPGTNDVYIASGVPGQNELHQSILKEALLVKVNSTGDYDPEHGVFPIETALQGSEVKPINGLAIDSSTGNERSGRVYLTTGAPEQRVDILGEPMPPDIAIDPVDPEAIEPHAVTVSGTINPNGNKIHTSYRFETVTQGHIWESHPIPNVDIGNGSAPVAVEQAITGLRANTVYKVRLTAVKGQALSSPEESFTTPPTGPDIETGTAKWSGPPASSPSLTFSGSVDDNNLPVHYYFEYGTDTSYGNRVPFFETGTHPGVQQAFTARETVNGLDPAGTYHYRLIARTSSGASVGLDREIGPAAEGRFPELVSPVDKGVGTVGEILFFTNEETPFRVAENGNKITYPYEYGMKDATAGGYIKYLADREPLAGWQNSQLTLPSTGNARNNSASNPGAAPARVKWQSPDLSCTIFKDHGKPTPDTPDFDAISYLYRQDEAGNLTRMTPTPLQFGSVLSDFDFVAGGTPDCNRVVFQTTDQLLPAVPPGTMHVYEWENSGAPNGTLRSVDILPDGSINSTDAFYGAYDYLLGKLNAAGGPGLSRVFFTAISDAGGDSGKQAVFVRKNHTVTVDASQSQTATANNGNSRYELASKDGSHVFFRARSGIAANGSSSAGPSTCDSGESGSGEMRGEGCDLYDYNVDTGVLKDLTPDTNVADTSGAYVVGTYGASDDGSYVYFAAKGQLVAGQGRTYAQNTPEGANVYLSHNGTLSFVGVIAGAAEFDQAFVGGNLGLLRAARVTPDGHYLLFRSKLNQTPYDSHGIPELYRYSSAGTSMACVSCRPDGLPPQALNGGMLSSSFGTQLGNNYLSHAISDNGSRVFFTSEDKLTPDAVATTPVDGMAFANFTRNTYEWHDGALHLLASGGAVVDSSPDGSNVFVLTTEALVPQDRDSAPDIYDFRLGGGFPYFPPEPCDPLTENSCQGTPPPPPAPTPDPASSTFSGPGNPAGPVVKAKHPKKPHKKHGKHHKKANKRAAKHNGGGSK